MTERGRDETIEDASECCGDCAHGLRPGMLMLVCGKAQSEFYGGPVHVFGWCPWFALAHPGERVQETKP